MRRAREAGRRFRGGGRRPFLPTNIANLSAWYDPSAEKTLLSDFEGTQATTGDAVALMLDRSQGAALGAEIISDPNFQSSGDWTKGTGITVGGGTATFTSVTAGQQLTPASGAATVVGEVYEVVVTIDSLSGGNLAYDAGASDAGTVTFTSAGTYTLKVPSVTNTNNHRLRVASGTVTAEVSQFSAKKISGNHAHQSTSGARPVYQTSDDRLVFDKSDDNMDVPGITSLTGSLVQASEEGIVRAEVDISSAWSLTQTAAYFPSNNIVNLILTSSTMSDSDYAQLETWLQGERGAGLDFAGVTNMQDWFRSRTDITAIDGSSWDTSSVTTFRNFALGCSSLTTLDVSSWDTSSVTNFQGFAFGCSSLTTLDVSNWDTSSVTTFLDFVRGCSSLTTLDVSSWDTSSVTTFQFFAFGCSSLTTLDVSSWDTSSVTNFSAFAFGCSSLTTLDVSSWDTSSVTNFSSFANGCSSLTTLDVSSWDTSSVTTFRFFAQNCSSLTTLDVSNWDTSSVTTFQQFAQNCSSLTTVTVNGGTGSPFSDSPCTNYTNAFLNTDLSESSIDDILVAIEAAGTSSGTFDQSGGSAPSATGEAAIDALRARGWTVAVTGGY